MKWHRDRVRLPIGGRMINTAYFNNQSHRPRGPESQSCNKLSSMAEPRLPIHAALRKTKVLKRDLQTKAVQNPSLALADQSETTFPDRSHGSAASCTSESATKILLGWARAGMKESLGSRVL